MQLRTRQELLDNDTAIFDQNFDFVQPEDEDDVNEPLIRPIDRQPNNDNHHFGNELDRLRFILENDGNRQPPNQRELSDVEFLLQRYVNQDFGERNTDTESVQSDVLNTVRYQDVKDNLDYNECSICLDPFNEDPDGELIYLPCNENHIFHAKCIKEWLQNKRECPLCKNRVTRHKRN